jgi:hypothetical protein
MSRHLYRITILSSLVLLAAVVIIAGCSSHTPTSPLLNSPTELTKQLPEPLELVAVSQLVSPNETDTIEIIQKTSIDKFIVPAGALNTAKTIEIKTKKDKTNGIDRLVFEFGPEGLVFNSATHLNVDITKLKATARTANLYYFDPTVNDWVYQGTVVVDQGRVDFRIYHFSKYAIE